MTPRLADAAPIRVVRAEVRLDELKTPAVALDVRDGACGTRDREIRIRTAEVLAAMPE